MRTYVAAICLLVLAASGVTASPATWTISGTVTNHTGKAHPAAGLPAKLTAYVDGAEQDWKAATTDARGTFTFSVPADAKRTYAVQVKYKGGEYDSPTIEFKPGESSKRIAMRVYEPTSDTGVLRVNVHHIIVEAGEAVVQVAELLVFTNTTDRTYIGGAPRADGKRETLRFSLPAGASNVQYMEGLMECCVFATDSGMVDTMDVEPGMRQIGYAYTLPASRGRIVASRAVDYPTDRVEVFANATLQLDAAPLMRQHDVSTDQGTYIRYSRERVEAGTQVRLALSGILMPRAAARRVALAAFAGFVAAALAYPLLRRRQRRAGEPGVSQTREELIAAVAALDDRFEAGDIPETEYRQRREGYMAKLRRIASAGT